jgi:DHA1 family multidrug resistance protein-like MFS transporter
MKDIIRDATVGQIINYVSGGRYLPYADQKPDYIIPEHFFLPSSMSQTQLAEPTDDSQHALGAEQSSVADKSPRRMSGGSITRINTPTIADTLHDDEKGDVKSEILAFDPYLVGWNGDDDPENPRYEHTYVLCISY